MSIGAPASVRRVRWYHVPVAFAASLLLSLIAGVVYLLWQALTQPDFDLGLYPRDFYFLSTVQAGACLGMLLASLWFFSRISDLPCRFRVPSLRDLLTALGAALVLMLAATLFEIFCDTFLGTHLAEDTARLPIAPRSWAQLPLGILVIAVLAPLSEEAFFRGLLLGWLHRHWGRWPAILGSSLVFGLVHLKMFTAPALDGWLLTLELSAMGAAFALLALRTGNLWVSGAVHALNNLCVVLVVFFFFPAA